MTEAAAAMSALLQAHRSIRRYDEGRDVDRALVEQVLTDAFAGSSSSGNLNMSSVVLTRDVERRRRLYELHFEQPMVLQAPLVLTFCADTFRTRTWLAQRGARLGFADLISWHVSAFDAIIFAQSAALAFESRGLGICYMGTTLHSMQAIAEFLELPDNCLPVTSMVVGWPAEQPAQRDRLPAAAWIHEERYRRPGPADVDRLFGSREQRGWERYRAMGEEMIRLMEAHGITSLAQFYTSRVKYDPDTFRVDSDALRQTMESRGFLP